MSAKFAFIIPDVGRGEHVDRDSVRQVSKNPERQNVRRPLESMEAAEDNYATLSLRVAGAPQRIKNTSATKGTAVYNANFMVESINFSTQEKSQLAQTFDRDRMFFYGQSLPALSVSARVIDNATFQWLQEFYENYTAYIGGSSSAERGGQVQLRIDGKIFTGYITQMSFNTSATDLHQANLGFTMSVFDTKFSSRLRSTASVLRATDKSKLEDSLLTISSILGNQSLILRNRVLTDPDQTLSSQIQIITSSSVELNFSEEISLKESVTRKSVPLKDAYPNEFPYDEKGRSYDEISDANRALRESNDLVIISKTGRSILAENTMDLDNEGRDAVVTAIVQSRILIGKFNDIRFSNKVSPEDVYTPYVKPTPSSVSPLMAAAKSVGSAAGYLALSSIASGLAEESLSGNFSLERAGKRVMDKALGTSTLNPPFDDSKIIPGLA